MDWSKISYVLHAIGLGGIVRTVQYGLLRDRIENQYFRSLGEKQQVHPGVLSNMTQINNVILFEYEHAQAELFFMSPNMVRISWTPGRPPIPYTIEKTNWDTPNPIISIDSSDIEIDSGILHIFVSRHGDISIGSGFDKIYKRDTAPFLEGSQWNLSTLLTPEEHIYGLGERDSHLNLRPGKYTSWNTDIGGRHSRGMDPLYIGTPVYLSMSKIGSHLVYFENSYRSMFELNDRLVSTFTGGMLRYYVIIGPLEVIYKQYAELTGFPCLPPRWALGYHQSRWSYKTEAEIYSVIEGFEKYKLPISAIHLDIDYMDGFRLFTFNKKRFRNIRKLTANLEGKGVKVVTSINPAVKRDQNYSLFKDGLEMDVFCKLPDGKDFTGVSWPGWCVFPDFTKPAIRSWWQEQYKVLLDAGIAGIWHDMNEPASFAAWGDKSFPLSIMHSMETQGANHLEAHNVYGLLMDRAGYEALQKSSPAKRPWILSRSGWAGMQRYAWNWTGDVETSWESLQQTIPTILGLSLSGHGFSGVDIGGFSGTPSAELFLRWFQLATFLPFFRTHSAVGTRPREPWVYGEPTTSIIRKFLELRYKLIPYLYSLAWNCTKNGLPPLRPVFWNSPMDQTLWEIEDEFILGDAILVVPVQNLSENSRSVVLPSGRWYSFWDDRLFVGPIRINVPVTPETIPIFIKGGTVLPFEENNQLTLHVYVDDSESSVSNLYIDAGDGYGPNRLDTFNIARQHSLLEISWEKAGDYPFLYPEIKIQIHGIKLNHANVDGSDVSIHDNSFNTPIFTKIKLIYSSI